MKRLRSKLPIFAILTSGRAMATVTMQGHVDNETKWLTICYVINDEAYGAY